MTRNISENGFRAILGLPLESPFEIGCRQGKATGQHVSYRQVAEHFTEFSHDQIREYLNGRDDGVAGDSYRVDLIRAA